MTFGDRFCFSRKGGIGGGQGGPSYWLKGDRGSGGPHSTLTLVASSGLGKVAVTMACFSSVILSLSDSYLSTLRQRSVFYLLLDWTHVFHWTNNRKNTTDRLTNSIA